MAESADAPTAPCSLWEQSAPEEPAGASLAGAQESDLVIVGGGITGLCAGLRAAQAGVTVAIVESETPGWGASGRNGGQVIAGLKYDPDELVSRYGASAGDSLVALSGSAPDLVFQLIARHDIECDARRSGWLQAAPTRQALAKLASRAQQWGRRGTHVSILDRAKIAELTGTSRYLGGWIDHRGGTIQPLRYARGLARAAMAAGAKLYTHSPALRLSPNGSAWRITTAQGHIDARSVVLAGNGYTDRLWPGLAQTLVPAYSFQIATRPLPPALRAKVLPSALPVSEAQRLLHYYRYDESDRLVMGGRGPFRESPTPADARSLIQAMTGLFPALAETPIDCFWSGRIGMTRDHMPHLHQLAPNVFTALGYNGRGVALATALGTLLGERVAQGSMQGSAFPITRAKPMPLHRFHRPVAKVAIQYYRLRDRLDRRH